MQPSRLFLLTSVAFAVGGALLLIPPILKILLGMKKGSQINIAPYLTVSTAWLAWAVFTLGVAILCLSLVCALLVLRGEEKRGVQR